MLELFDAIFDFLVLGRDTPLSFRSRPRWQRIPLVILSLMLVAAFAAMLAAILFLFGSVVLGLFHGSGS